MSPSEDDGVFSRWGKKLSSFWGTKKDGTQKEPPSSSPGGKAELKTTVEVEAATNQKRAWLDQQATLGTIEQLASWPSQLIENFYIVGLPPDTEVTQIAYDLAGRDRLARDSDSSQRTPGAQSSAISLGTSPGTGAGSHLQHAYSRSIQSHLAAAAAGPGAQRSAAASQTNLPSAANLMRHTSIDAGGPQALPPVAVPRRRTTDGVTALGTTGAPETPFGGSRLETTPSLGEGVRGSQNKVVLDDTAIGPRSSRSALSFDKAPTPSYPASVLFRYPSAQEDPSLSDQEVAELCFPNQVTPRRLRRSPSWSALYGVLNTRANITLGTAFFFTVKSVNRIPLYGVCYTVEEPLHRPPSMAQSVWPNCSGPYRQCLITAPRCYCITSHYPFFHVLTQALELVVSLERVSRSLAFTRELQADRGPPHSLRPPARRQPSRSQLTPRQQSSTPKGTAEQQQQQASTPKAAEEEQQQENSMPTAATEQQAQQQQKDETALTAQAAAMSTEQDCSEHHQQEALGTQNTQAPGDRAIVGADAAAHTDASRSEHEPPASAAPDQPHTLEKGSEQPAHQQSGPNSASEAEVADDAEHSSSSAVAAAGPPTADSAGSSPRAGQHTRNMSMSSFYTAADTELEDTPTSTPAREAPAPMVNPASRSGGAQTHRKTRSFSSRLAAAHRRTGSQGHSVGQQSRLGMSVSQPGIVGGDTQALAEGSLGTMDLSVVPQSPTASDDPDADSRSQVAEDTGSIALEKLGSHWDFSADAVQAEVEHEDPAGSEPAADVVATPLALDEDSEREVFTKTVLQIPHHDHLARLEGTSGPMPSPLQSAASTVDAPGTPAAYPVPLVPPRVCRSLASEHELTCSTRADSRPATDDPDSLGHTAGSTPQHAAVEAAAASAAGASQEPSRGSGSGNSDGNELGAVVAAGSEDDTEALKAHFNPLSVIDSLLTAPVPTPGDYVQIPLGELPQLVCGRWVLTRRWPVIAPAAALAAYAEDELTAELAPWATAVLARSLTLPALLSLLSAALLERPIVFFHPDPALLTTCVLGVLPMLRPFTWQCVVMPMIPSSTLSLLDAPVPFLAGCQYKTPEITAKCTSHVRVNLYKGSVSNTSHLPPLPGLKRLMSRISHYHDALRQSEAAYVGTRNLDKGGCVPGHVVPPEQLQAASAMLWEIYVHLAGIPHSPDTETRTSDPPPMAHMVGGGDTPTAGVRTPGDATPGSIAGSLSVGGAAPVANKARAGGHARSHTWGTAPWATGVQAPEWEGVVGELRPHMITYLGPDGRRTATLLRESLIEVQGVKERPWVKAFLDTQMFQVYSDMVMAAFCEGRRWD